MLCNILVLQISNSATSARCWIGVFGSFYHSQHFLPPWKSLFTNLQTLAVLPLSPRPSLPSERVRHYYRRRSLPLDVCYGSQHTTFVEDEIWQFASQDGPDVTPKILADRQCKTRRSDPKGNVVDGGPGPLNLLGWFWYLEFG